MDIDLQQLQNQYASKLGVLEANNTLLEVQLSQLQKQLDELKAKQQTESKQQAEKEGK